MDDLDRLLKMRADAPRRDGLEARILAASQPAMVAFILLPRPVLMLALLLFIGLGMGLYSPDFVTVDYVELLLDDDSFGDVI